MKEKTKTYGEHNQLNLKTVIGLYRTYFSVQRSTQKLMAHHNLTVSQFGVLEALYHIGPMKIGDIIERVLSTSGNMTVVIKNLEQDGWIRREPDPGDRRAALIQLTERGAKLIETVFPDHLKSLDENLGNLNEAEKEHLVHLFKKLNGV